MKNTEFDVMQLYLETDDMHTHINWLYGMTSALFSYHSVIITAILCVVLVGRT